MSDITKNQHYISRALLQNFTNANNQLFEVLLSTKKIYPTNPTNSMCASLIYEDDKLKINTTEKFFCKIEEEAVPLINTLIDDINEFKCGNLGFPELKRSIEHLLPILIIFYYRSGALLTEFSSFNEKEKVYLLLEKILNHKYINLLAKTIQRHYKFAIIESDKDFLLSDQFISTTALKVKTRFFEISNRHIGLKETLILIPICSSYYAAYWNSERDFIIQENSFKTLSEEEIIQINRTIINNSYIKCVATKMKRIEEVLEQYRMQYPSQVFSGGGPGGHFAGAIKKKEIFFFEEEEKIWNLLEFANFTNYKGLGRNDKCKCGSNKKFKKCHEDALNRVMTIIKNFNRNGHQTGNRFGIIGAETYELPIDQWSGFDKDKDLRNQPL